ncbi:MAG: ABC-F family ATP-binding cassette domain-containing protein [Puniceicoccales bacterium]|jgi:ATP-binding cassette subfamily F protein 3|nr:ABC-F family ATP-binding cassette domain-containing protein [Puniceicoccales bacterium]
MIDIDGLTHRIGGRVLFENATLHMPSNGKIGLVGPNGCGKTTLFRIIFGQEEIDGGTISIVSGAKLVCVKQEIEDGEISLIDFVIDADHELVGLKKILDGVGDITDDALAQAYNRYEAIDGYSAEARAASILAGLGFKHCDLRKDIHEFSGGWQVRAALAATLFAPSDCLMLDEPTNHLDLETAMWLENYLDRTNKMVVMISHEKQFLNKICNYIVSIHDRQLQLFRGNYDTYIDTRDKRETALIKTIETQQKKREHIQSFVDRFGAKATKAKQAQSRLKMIEKMQIPPMPSSQHGVKLSFSKPHPHVDRKIITMENVSAGYGENIVLKNVEFCVNFGDRIALLGANGNGKSTLAKLLSARLAPRSGNILYAKNAKISYFSQQQADELDMVRTPTETIRSIARDFSETQARSHLARFGVTQARSETPIKNLSGGEKSRVLLAINSLHCPHAMVLDEPTNHLDIDAREALVVAINKYEGAVVLITHDFYTLHETCRQFFIVDGGKCTPFSGTLEEYRELLLARDSPKADPTVRRKSNRPKATRNVSALEKAISAAEETKKELESKLSRSYDGGIYDSYVECCEKLKALEEEWLALGD